MYRVYLRTFDQQVLPESKTNTRSQQAAADAFTELVNRADLDGQKLAGVLSFNSKQLAFHRFDREPGQRDYWRDKLDDIEWPSAGRPTELLDGKSVRVYLDAESRGIAERIGSGNVSEGIRLALAAMKDRK
jgi:hypothetical protein